MVVGVALGWVAVVLGLVVSYRYGTAAGATMAGISVAGFFLVLAGQELARGVQRHRPTWEPVHDHSA
jgi:ABC-type Mn2+/Zn2+ transport system permease subunit